jgi:DNA-binding transcriptional MocR family regulator
LKAVYVQTALHNPLGGTMTAERRADLVAVLHDRDLLAIEDSVYAFLADDQPPLAALAPDRAILVDSASKRLSPGLTTGYVVPPAHLTDRLTAALRSGGWGVRQFPLSAVTRLTEDGTVATIERAKRADAKARQHIVREKLVGFAVRTDPRSYHCWWELPAPWRAETFVAAAARRGIAVTPAAAFTAGSGHAPNAVRLALSTPPLATLAAALDALAALARHEPDPMD